MGQEATLTQIWSPPVDGFFDEGGTTVLRSSKFASVACYRPRVQLLRV